MRVPHIDSNERSYPVKDENQLSDKNIYTRISIDDILNVCNIYLFAKKSEGQYVRRV